MTKVEDCEYSIVPDLPKAAYGITHCGYPREVVVGRVLKRTIVAIVLPCSVPLNVAAFSTLLHSE